jgi:sialidase-1
MEEIRYSTIAKTTQSNPRNDTGSVVELRNGNLLVLWHKYEASAEPGHDLAPCRIHAKTSQDQGMTWADERMIVDVAPGDRNVHSPAIARLPTGELLMLCLRAHSDRSTTMCTYLSDDDGAHFAAAGTVWERSPGQWLQGGAACIVVLSSGRLLVPCHGGTGGQFRQHNTAWCWLSDDAGRTWERSEGTLDLPLRGAMEASVAEHSTGRLFMSLRTQLGAIFLTSSDDGGNTWSLPQTTGLGAPESGSCLRRVPDSDTMLLIWNDSTYEPAHHHFGRRRPLSMAISSDGCQSWSRIGDLETGEYELTNIGCTFTTAGNAVVTYMQVDDRNWERFTRVGIDLLAAIVPLSRILG